MSDTSQGPGWWQASDGKWYAPELYPSEWPRPDEPAVSAGVAAAPAAPTDEPVPLVADPGAATSVVPPAPDLPSGWSPPAGSPPAPALDPTTVIAAQADLRDTTRIQPPLDTPAPPSWAGAPPPGAPSAPAPPAHPTVWPQPSAPQPGPALAPPGSSGAPAWNPSAPAPGAWPSTGAPVAPATAATADVPAALLAILGGAALAVTAFFNWATLTGSRIARGDVNGLSDSNGPGMLIAGGVAVLGGLLLLAKQRKAIIGLLIVLAGLAAVGLWIFSYWDLGDPLLERTAERLVEAGQADIVPTLAVTREPIMWVTLAGAAVATLAGFLALARRQ